MGKKPVVVDGVEQEVQPVVEERVPEDHVEELEHDVEDNEVVVVLSLANEGPVLAKCQGEVVGRLPSVRPCQSHWAEEVKSSMSSEAKSSEKIAKKAGETKVSIPCQ